MKTNLFLFSGLLSWVALYYIAEARHEKEIREYQKKYQYTDHELDQCVKRNLELRRK